jgi:hypothetical protein
MDKRYQQIETIDKNKLNLYKESIEFKNYIDLTLNSKAFPCSTNQLP